MTTTAPIRTARPDDRSRRLLERVSRARELGIVAAILIVFAVTTVKNHAFANGASIQQLLAGASLIALLGAGQTMVIVTRNVDLSIGSVLGISAYIVGDLFVHHPRMPLVLAYVVGIGIGAGFGAINGLITTLLRVPSLVVTLAALYIIRGLDAVIANGKQIDPTSIPKSFQKIGSADIFNIPWLAILVAIVIAAIAYAMRTFR